MFVYTPEMTEWLKNNIFFTYSSIDRNTLRFFFLIENVECARHCPKCFLDITLFIPLDNDAESVIVFISQTRELSSEMLYNLEGHPGDSRE